MKSGRALSHPTHKFLQSRMRTQGFNRIVVPCQFRLGQRDMDLIVANLMKQHDRATLSSFQLRGQMVQALTDFRRDGAMAERADRIAHCDQSTAGPAGTMPSGLRSPEGEK